MSDGVRYWIIFIQGTNDNNEEELFCISYVGNSIQWIYLLELVEEDYNLRQVHFNGYNEISEREYNRIWAQ